MEITMEDQIELGKAITKVDGAHPPIMCYVDWRGIGYSERLDFKTDTSTAISLDRAANILISCSAREYLLVTQAHIRKYNKWDLPYILKNYEVERPNTYPLSLKYQALVFTHVIRNKQHANMVICRFRTHENLVEFAGDQLITGRINELGRASRLFESYTSLIGNRV